MPKEFRATMTVNVFITADSQEEADSKFEDMEIDFRDPYTDEILQSDLIDWDVTEVGEFEEEETEFDDDL